MQPNLSALAKLWLCGLTLVAGSGVALGDDIEGIVRVTGSAINAHTYLADGDAKDGPSLCNSELEKSVRRLGGMTIKVSGDWRLDKKGDKTCLEAGTFTVLKASSGRDAVVGTLSRKDGVYVVTGGDGKVHTLETVPGGLKKLDGMKVILDIKPLNSPTAKEAVYKVVTYAAHP